MEDSSSSLGEEPKSEGEWSKEDIELSLDRDPSSETDAGSVCALFSLFSRSGFLKVSGEEEAESNV